MMIVVFFLVDSPLIYSFGLDLVTFPPIALILNFFVYLILA
ncbi:MAG: hypothetical protein BWY08_00388 [Bacteroidetes bacterium ADurb.Bin174]|nr:MAG: hypothetical protein BWY08_00388 [Bacteroidetes bacterium ADurb.Bin174]